MSYGMQPAHHKPRSYQWVDRTTTHLSKPFRPISAANPILATRAWLPVVSLPAACSTASEVELNIIKWEYNIQCSISNYSRFPSAWLPGTTWAGVHAQRNSLLGLIPKLARRQHRVAPFTATSSSTNEACASYLESLEIQYWWNPKTAVGFKILSAKGAKISTSQLNLPKTCTKALLD